eukprot:gene11328-15192_t
MKVVYLFIVNILISIVTSNRFDPYTDNGGTIMAISGKEYIILASDTRLSEQYSIKSRSISRIFQITDDIILCGSGCFSDTIALSKVLKSEAMKYEWNNDKSIHITAMSSLLAFILYQRRLFPYFSFNVIAGFNSKGNAEIYRYDAVGSYERVQAACCGKGEQMIQPLLDEVTNLEEDSSLWDTSSDNDMFESCNVDNLNVKLDCEQMLNLIIKSFRAAAEREISVGDGIEKGYN